jgi:hypothetical protein
LYFGGHPNHSSDCCYGDGGKHNILGGIEMENTYSPGLTVVVGDEYAKVLGYEDSVGEMGIIYDVMSALCGVTLLTGSSVGKQVDLHKQDCVIQEEERKSYSVVVNFRTGNIYYTENRELLDYTAMCIGRNHSREFHDVPFVHEVLDFCEKNHSDKKSSYGFEWITHCLDDRADEESRKYLETYEAEVACREAEEEAFQESKLKQMELTASLLKQMKTQTKVDKVVEEWVGSEDDD